MMIDMDDPEHFKRRKLVNRGFTPKRVRDKETSILKACDEIIDAVIDKGECDFVRDIAAPLPMAVIGDMLGVAHEDRATLLEWSDTMVSSQSGTMTDEMALRAGEAFGAYNAHAEAVIADPRGCPAEDLMSVLVHAEVDGDRLTDDDIKMESLLILIGGDETTRHVLSGGMEQLMAHPDQRQLLIDDPSRIRSRSRRCCAGSRPSRTCAASSTRTPSSAASRSRPARS